jgi:transcriptional regulator with XRE-family HTH domain
MFPKGGQEMSTLGERIKQIRMRASLTQTEFGKELGVSGATVSTSESGKTNPEARTLILICEKFGINREWLETGEGEMLKHQESDALIPALRDVLAEYPAIANALGQAMSVMTAKDFARLNEIIDLCAKKEQP